MSKQFTAEESMNIKDYLHLYLGCEVARFYSDGVPSENCVNRAWLIAAFENISNGGSLGCVYKPILRSLSSLEGYECIDIYTIERDRFLHLPTEDFDIRKEQHGFIITRLDLLNERLMVGFNGQIYKVIEDGETPHIEPIRNQHEITRYLLSKHFDLFGLIDADLAIDKTKLKEETT